jgi:exonuclease SbcC
MATAKDAYIELIGENDQPFAIRLDCDSHSGRQEAVIRNGSGDPLAGPKVRDFDAYVAQHFPPLEVYLASFFASQTGMGSVLKMSRSDRRSLFGRLLGLERLEQMATAARERARAAETEIAAARAALDAIRSGAEDVSILEDSLELAKMKEAKAAEASRKAAEKLREVMAERDRLSAAIVEAERAEKAAKEAERRVEAAKESVARLEVRVRAFKPLLARAAEIREAAAKIKDLTADMERARIEGEALSATRDQAQKEVNEKSRTAMAAEQKHKEAGRSVCDATVRADEMKKRLESANKATGSVPCAGVLEDTTRSACSALVGHFKIRDEAKQYLDEYAETASKLEANVVAAGENYKKASWELDDASRRLGVIDLRVNDLRSKYREVRAKVDELKAKDQSAELDRAEAETSGLQAALETAHKSATEAEAEAARLRDAIPAVDSQEIQAAQEEVDDVAFKHEHALQESRDAAAQIARTEEQLRAAREAHVKAQALVARLAPIEADLAEWRWLGRGLGREGVQALELDAAGPQVSNLANELLAAAYGSRFAIRLETQAAKADGKGVKETFDVIVVDTERGREGNGEDLSGGEKVIVGEALGLGVALFHTQAAGVSLGTCIRDETVGALDPDNAQHYIAMLKGFLRIGLVHQLLYVAHNPELVQMADAVVYVDNGRIEVK